MSMETPSAVPIFDGDARQTAVLPHVSAQAIAGGDRSVGTFSPDQKALVPDLAYRCVGSDARLFAVGDVVFIRCRGCTTAFKARCFFRGWRFGLMHRVSPPVVRVTEPIEELREHEVDGQWHTALGTVEPERRAQMAAITAALFDDAKLVRCGDAVYATGQPAERLGVSWFFRGWAIGMDTPRDVASVARARGGLAEQRGGLGQ